MARPILTQTNGYPWTKLVVPSNGSMNHVGASVSSEASCRKEDSSPMNCKKNCSRVSGRKGMGGKMRTMWSGYADLSLSMMNSSHF